jgi:hypothetical protein
VARSDGIRFGSRKNSAKVSAVQQCVSKAGTAKAGQNCMDIQRIPAYYSPGVHKQ